MRSRDQLRGSMDHRANQGFAGADDLVAGEQRAQPVGQVDQLRSADAGEEIFRSAGKSRDFVRKHGAADQDVIVVENQAVQLDRNGFLQQSAGQFRDLARGDLAQVRKILLAVPTMVEDAMPAADSVGDAPADQPRKLSVVHRLVRAQRHQEIERPDAPAQFGREDPE